MKTKLPFLLPALALFGLAAASRGAERDPWWSPGEGRVFPAVLDYANEHGVIRTLLNDGPVRTEGHPFF